MYYTYVLLSKEDENFYIGHTSDLRKDSRSIVTENQNLLSREGRLTWFIMKHV